MKLSLSCLLLAAVAPFATASSDPKQVVVSYPDGTPQSLLDEAKHAIIEGGGIITHEYYLIKGFAANAPAKILETLQSLEAHSSILIEEDQVFTINDA